MYYQIGLTLFEKNYYIKYQVEEQFYKALIRYKLWKAKNDKVYR